ncbi:putative polyglutamine synthesis accessory protein [Rhizobiaceae bacterium]|nr:putative polyglutamine synthesis accessory protein [Rhizobiaceae bacterium]
MLAESRGSAACPSPSRRGEEGNSSFLTKRIAAAAIDGILRSMRLFLSGDVMTGRGIDQILPHPNDPAIHEDYLKSAADYVALAERASGPIPRGVPPAYIWGDALAEIERRSPDLRIVNLETALTARGRPEPKGINYRMNPANVACLTAAGIGCCVLANNHVLDWGEDGFADTLAALEGAGIVAAGAGRDAETAWRPAILPAPGGRLLVFAVGCASAGVPASWAADPQRPGVARIGEADDESARRIARHVESWRKPGDTVVVSIHWGGNWGYAIPGEHRRFATILAAEAGVDIVHGHSSHHPIALETVDGRPVLYGCGDFINDYEGISGYEAYRPDLSLAYVIDIGDGPTRVTMVPFRMRRFRLERATAADAKWLAQRLDRECRRLGSRIALDGDGCLVLQA